MKQYLNKHIFFRYAVIGLLILRGYLNSVLPLMDKTEARYAEIARIMAETGNWITPQIDYGIPFWAKPPLSTWLSALSFNIFGVNEFTARFPYLLLTIIMIFLVGKYAKRVQHPFFLPGFILLTTPEFLLHAGVVSTDTALAFCITLTMLSFWEAMQNKAQWYWKYLLFIGLGFGLLAKGPIVLILTIPPIFIWILIYKKTRIFLQRVHLTTGVLLILAIALPWYILAEINSPGFINYFIIGEHFKRFFDSSWSEDKYGFPKSQPIGVIWVFLLFFALKWIQITLYKLWKNRKILFQNKWVCFLTLWLFWTPLFFTFSKSLIHPYILPTMVPIALLITHWFHTFKKKKLLLKLALIIPITSLILIIPASILKYTRYFAPTDKYLIKNNVLVGNKTFHFKEKSYSSQFYSEGKIKSISTEKLLEKTTFNTNSFRLIISNKEFKKLSLSTQKKLQLLDKNHKKSIYGYFRKIR